MVRAAAAVAIVCVVFGTACSSNPLSCNFDRDCAAGSKCVKGTCSSGAGGGGSQACSAASCGAGCCNGDTCEAGRLDTSCGASGSRCLACPKGQHCDAGACEGCNALSCPGGCCTGPTCNTPALQHCGADAGVCFSCYFSRADSCTSGECRCGSGPPCASGQQCDAGTRVCTEASCPSGCCSGDSCQAPAFPSCGDGGVACRICDPLLSDCCEPFGGCVCGATSQPCATGQRCSNGTCTCDATTCDAGCCSSTGCTPRTASACGPPGQACVSCSATLADTCGPNGDCQCGAAASCRADQRCVGGACVCNPDSCPNGCCAGGQSCVDPPALAACGSAGVACVACDARSNVCDAGSCGCGAGGACAIGQVCVNGACQCNAGSCPNGCCSNGTCVATPSPTQCGPNGGTCVSCGPSGDGCLNGQCRCGAGPGCAQGERCNGTSCACDPNLCTAGCCGNYLKCANVFPYCGPPNTICVRCGAESTHCVLNQCSCGPSGGACLPTETCGFDRLLGTYSCR